MCQKSYGGLLVALETGNVLYYAKSIRFIESL